MCVPRYRPSPGLHSSLMANSEDNPSRKQAFIDRQRTEWIWEFVLRHCCDVRVIRLLAEGVPIPDDSVLLKRLFLLRSLSFDVMNDRISERTLDAVRAIAELNRLEGSGGPVSTGKVAGRRESGDEGQGSFYELKEGKDRRPREGFHYLKELCFVVMVECTIQHLREDADDWPSFNIALEKFWGDSVEDTEEREDDSYRQKILSLRKKLWEVRRHPDLRHEVLRNYKRDFVKNMLQCFLDESWTKLGPTFLESVADNIGKGVYLPFGHSASQARKQIKVSEKGIIGMHKTSRELMPDRANRAIETGDSGALNIEKEKGREREDEITTVRVEQPAKEVSGDFRGHEFSLQKTVAPKYNFRDKTNVAASQPEANVASTYVEFENRNCCSSLQPLNNLNNGGGNPEKIGKETRKEKQNDKHAANVIDSAARMRSERGHGHACLLTELSDPAEELSSLSPRLWAGSPVLPYREFAAVNGDKKQRFDCFLDPEVGPSLLLPSTHSKPDAVTVLEAQEILKAQRDLKESRAQLHAVVTDPLPEALGIAEKSLGLIENATVLTTKPSVEGTTSAAHVNLTCQVMAGGLVIPVGDSVKQLKRNLLDRNPTARTHEWEESEEIIESPDSSSPSMPKRVRLPRGKGFGISPLQDSALVGPPHRRKQTKWTQDEVETLKKEVDRYGKGRWKFILETNRDMFKFRTEVDLKDKWRNIERQEGIH